MIILPLKVVLPRKTKKDKNLYLNLNTYRNLNFIINNQAKKIFKEDMKETLQGVVFKTPMKIEYTYYANSARKSDISNMCCVVDKFFCDALTEYGCIPDDNFDYIKRVEYIYGGIDRNNGRVEVEMIELEDV